MPDLHVVALSGGKDSTAMALKLAKEHHPDTGGDPEKMARINEARNQARKERGQ